jgi:hypothetical protein
MFILAFIQIKMQFETPPVQFVQYLNGQFATFPFNSLGSFRIGTVPLKYLYLIAIVAAVVMNCRHRYGA